MAIWLYAKYYPNRHSSLRRTINSAQIEKLRDRRSSLEEVVTTIRIYNPPQTPPFEKEGLVVSLWLTSPKVSNIQTVFSNQCEMYPPKSLWEATFPIAILSFARYLRHSMQKLRGARLMLYAKRKGVMQILRLLWRGGYLHFYVLRVISLMCVELYCSV